MMLFQTTYLNRFARAQQPPDDPTPTLWQLLPLLGLAFVVWQTVGLVRLKAANRWIATILLFWLGVSGVPRLILLTPGLEHPVRVWVFGLLFAGFNVSSGWYLVRPAFRKFAVQFVTEKKAEKDSRLMMAAAQKQTEKEIQRLSKR